MATTVTAVLLWWSRWPTTWRRVTSFLIGVAGLAFLVLAVNSEGLRESRTVARYLFGQGFVTEQAAASASLPFYVLTAVCLLLGSLGLVGGDRLAEALARRWLLTAVGLSVGVTLLRFILEKAALPSPHVDAFGVFWLPPVMGAYFLAQRPDATRGLRRAVRELVGPLALYGLASRGFVSLLYIVASVFELGSHYDVSRVSRLPGGFRESVEAFAGSGATPILYFIVPQLFFWPLFTVVVGLLGAAAAAVVTRVWHESLATQHPPSRLQPGAKL